MKKRAIAILILIFLILFSCVGCEFYKVISDDIQRQHQISKLPDIDYDNEGNIVYNGCIYRYSEYFWYTSYSFALGKSEYVAKTKSDLIYPYAPVVAAGGEDFGEHVYIHFTPWYMEQEYIKSDFVFPNHMDIEIDDIYMTKSGNSYDKSVLSGENDANLYLNDILTEVDSLEIANIKLSEIKARVVFENYQAFCLDNIGVYVVNDVIYLTIGYFDSEYNVVQGVYRVNNEYQKRFKNTVAELLE